MPQATAFHGSRRTPGDGARVRRIAADEKAGDGRSVGGRHRWSSARSTLGVTQAGTGPTPGTKWSFPIGRACWRLAGLLDLRSGCPLPAVLPAVSGSASRFLTRSDPQSHRIFPTNTGFIEVFVESGTVSKPGARRTSGRSSTRSTVHGAAAHANAPPGPAGRNRISPIVVPRAARTTGSDSKPEFSVSAPSSMCSSTTISRPSQALPVPRRLSVPEVPAYSASIRRHR